MTRIFFVITFLFFPVLIFSQERSERERIEIDSLVLVIKSAHLPDTAKILARLTLAEYYYTTDYDTTFIICHEAEKMSEKENWKYGLTESYGWLGYLYTNSGNFDKAIEYNKKSMKMARETGDMIAVTTLLNNNAAIYKNQGKIQLALEEYYTALAIHESSGNETEIARTLNSLGVIYKDQGFNDRALELYEKSLYMRREIGHKGDIGETLNNMGVLYASLGETEKAKLFYTEALQLRLEDGSPSQQANSYNNIGNLYSSIGEIDSAIHYLEKSLMIREKINIGPGICESSIDLGYTYFLNGEIKKAEEYSLKGNQMAREYGIARLIKNSSFTLCDIYLKKGNKAKAFDYYKAGIEMRDSMMNTETQKETVSREARYAYEKRKAVDDAEHIKNLAIKEEEKKRQYVIMIAAIGGLILVMFFLFFVFNRLRITKRQRDIIELQKKEVEQKKIEVEYAHEILEEKNSEILDSINYAKRIQSAILPPDKFFNEALPNSFVLYLPKDIVAGDFYWLQKKDDVVLFAAADCTGHGVPGAMVSVVCNNALNRSVREYGLTDPGKILDKTREIVITEFERSDEEVKDGMDIALVSLERKKSNENESKENKSDAHSILSYAGALNPLWIVRNGELIEFKADKQPVGKYDQLQPFITHKFELQPGDTFYIFSDGFADQFGGDRGKKMKSKGFRDQIISIQHLEMPEQKAQLEKVFLQWRGEFEQLDDVCVIGVRI